MSQRHVEKMLSKFVPSKRIDWCACSPQIVALDEARGRRTALEETVAVEAPDDVELVGDDHHAGVVSEVCIRVSRVSSMVGSEQVD